LLAKCEARTDKKNALCSMQFVVCKTAWI